MGMTIEQIIESLNYIKHIGNGEIEYRNCREAIALDMAVNIIHKYQQIEQILHNGFGKGVYAVFDEIVKVVEDGNVRNS